MAWIDLSEVERRRRMLWFSFYLENFSEKLFPESSSCYLLLSVSLPIVHVVARFSLPVDHLNAPRPSRCESLSFASRRLHHRVLISVPAPLWAHIESTATICLLFSHPASSFPQSVLKTFHHAISALSMIAPHCVESFECHLSAS